MKTIRLVFIAVFLCFAFAKAQSQPPQCYFINAQHGLNLRVGPSVNHEVQQKLPYGAQLKVLGKINPDNQEYVIDNGEKIYGNWVQVEPTFWDYRWGNKETSYVFDAYLSQHIESIPEHSLHNFTELHILHQHDDYEPTNGVSSRREMYRTGQKCDVRYEYNPAAKEALKDIIEFRVVNKEDYVDKKITGSFEIDTDWQPKKFKLNHDYRPVEWEQYYLPINNGKDSLHIKDHLGEWAQKIEYYGQIHALDSYLISGFAEDAEVIMVNRTTGKSSFLSNGMPQISPQGNYLVSEYFNVFDTTTQFSIKQFNVEALPQEYYICFSSWITAGEFFWISENEFIISVYPMDVYRSNNDVQQQPIYLKSSIKF